jgi:hypothetical protein
MPETEHFIKDTLFSVVDIVFKNENIRKLFEEAIKNYLITKFYEKVEEAYKETEIGISLIELLIEFLNKKYSEQKNKTFDEFKRPSLTETIEAIRKEYPDLSGVLDTFELLVNKRVPRRTFEAVKTVSDLFNFLIEKHGIDVSKLSPEFYTTFEDKSNTIISILVGRGYVPEKITPTKKIDLGPIYDKIAEVLNRLYKMLGPLSEHFNIYRVRQDLKDRVELNIGILVNGILPDVDKKLSKDIESLGSKGTEIFSKVIENCIEYFTDKISEAFLRII